MYGKVGHERMNPIFFKNQGDLRTWYQEHHQTTSELLIGFYKLSSGKSGITYREAVDEALCFGWIDGVRKSMDAERWTIRFTPRTKKSIWSVVNLKRAAELEAAGQMQQAGLGAFHGRDKKRTKLYSFENRERKLDGEQEKKFRGNKKAWAWFSSQAPSYQHAASWWVVSAKQEATRANRLEILIRDSEAKVRVAPLRRRTGK